MVAEALSFKICTLWVEADLSVKHSKLETLKQSQEVVAAYDEIGRRFGDSTELHLRQILTGALFRKALALRQLGRHDEALAAFDEIVRRCGDSRQPDLCHLCDSALTMKSSTLDRLGRHQEALLAHYERVRHRCDYDWTVRTDPRLPARLCDALYQTGRTLGRLGRHQEALAVYGEIVSRFGESKDPHIHDQVAKARARVTHKSLLGRLLWRSRGG